MNKNERFLFVILYLLSTYAPCLCSSQSLISLIYQKMEMSENLFKLWDPFDHTFTKFKHDVDNITDHAKSIIIDVEELKDDFKHAVKNDKVKGFSINLSD